MMRPDPSTLSAEDKAMADAMFAAQAERKRLKTQARIAKLKAQQRGELRRMPLQGKAALAYILKDL